LGEGQELGKCRSSVFGNGWVLPGGGRPKWAERGKWEPPRAWDGYTRQGSEGGTSGIRRGGGGGQITNRMLFFRRSLGSLGQTGFKHNRETRGGKTFSINPRTLAGDLWRCDQARPVKIKFVLGCFQKKWGPMPTQALTG